MNAHKHKGMSLIGFLLVLAMVIFMAFMAMRIVPIYIEYYSVVSAMNGLAQERGSAKYSPESLKNKMMDRLWISYTDGNVKRENIRIVRNQGVQMRVAYEVRKPLLGNLDLMASFDNTVTLSN